MRSPSVSGDDIARASDPGSSPLAVEMSVDASRIAPGCGASEPGDAPEAQPEAVLKLRSCWCCQACR